ncbi:MAG: FtsW/RodA/SpoVE family cell cycle protein, partial [Candidatus Roizmanbacteria bacterium]|nr:FtsW/RodA/SpoVE family cell cycle protein [Candidatus Roizmanbacteria bacterium]
MKNTPFVLAVLLGLCGVGAQALFSPTSALYQLLFLSAGIILYIVITKKIAPTTVVHTSTLLSILGIVALAALLVFGDPVRGSRRWFPFFGFSLQPSVIFIPFFILTLSLWLNRFHPRESWGNYAKALLLCAVPSVLVFA